MLEVNDIVKVVANSESNKSFAFRNVNQLFVVVDTHFYSDSGVQYISVVRIQKYNFYIRKKESNGFRYASLPKYCSSDFTLNKSRILITEKHD